MVDPDAQSVEAALSAGKIECPECGQGLHPWGHARWRPLRDHGQPLPVRPRRTFCRECARVPGQQKTHVLLPKVALLRRADTAEVIGEALTATHVERRTRREVALQAGAPLETVRGWRRRFHERAEEIRVQFTELAHEWDPEQGPIEARGSPELDALEAMGMAARAAVRRFGPEPLWQLVAGASAGRLLSNTSSPLPLPP
jgi:hypothetical protein